MNERAIKSLMSTVSSLQVFDGQIYCGYLIVCLVKHCKYDLSKYVDDATCSLKLFSFLPGGEYFKRKVSVVLIVIQRVYSVKLQCKGIIILPTFDSFGMKISLTSFFLFHRLVKATADCETAQFQPSDCDVLPGKLVDFRKEKNIIREMNYLLGTHLLMSAFTKNC